MNKQPYKAVLEKNISNGPGYWDYQLVSILENDKKIGEYVRNYHGFAESTFCPFNKDGRWYALYSKEYTATRLMSLPDCRDICGEKKDAFGFCPVELYVPMYTLVDYEDKNKNPLKLVCEITDVKEDMDDKHDLFFFPFAFVAGCVWGDDSSWKIQYIDLSKVPESISRDDRFGYIEMGDSDIKSSVKIIADRMEDITNPVIEFSILERFNGDGTKIE